MIDLLAGGDAIIPAVTKIRGKEMDFKSDPAWLLSSAVFGIFLSIAAVYIQRFIDKKLEAVKTRRSASNSAKASKLALNKEAMIRSAAARDFFFKNAVWWGIHSIFLTLCTAILFTIFVGSLVLSMPYWIRTGMLVFGGLAFLLSFRSWLRCSDLMNQATDADAARSWDS